MLDGSKKTLLQRVGSGNIIRRFEKTPYPCKTSDVVCPHFLELAWSWGCPYNCAWCYLKGTYRFFEKDHLGRVQMHFKDRGEITEALTAFLRLDIPSEILNAGELSDALMGETQKPSFSKWLMRYMDGSRHKVLFLTKGTNVKNFLENEWQENAIMSWSINAEKVARKWEHLAPTPTERLNAARKVYEAGYEVRFRMDPMVGVEGWQENYARLIDEVFKRLTPERITLGSLRGLASTVAHVADRSWIEYLDESSSWGRKPNFEKRLAYYDFVISYLKQYGFGKIGICKETSAMWQNLNLSFKNIMCNCVA